MYNVLFKQCETTVILPVDECLLCLEMGWSVVFTGDYEQCKQFLIN